MMQTPNAQGLAGLMSQGRAPQQPQQPMPSPMKASPMASLGSVEDRVAAYRGNPAPLQQRYAMSQDLLDLLALQKIKSEKESAVRQMQMQMAQQQAAQGEGAMTVAQQREKEVMDMTKNELAQQRGDTAQQQIEQQQANMQKLMSGIARAPGAQAVAQPKMMAEGGIVAFAGPEGSVVPDKADKKPLDDAAKQELARAQMKGDRAAIMDVLRKLGAVGYDVATLIPRGLAGAIDTALIRPARAITGKEIPYLGSVFDTESVTPAMDALLRQASTHDVRREPPPAPARPAVPPAPAPARPAVPPAPAAAAPSGAPPAAGATPGAPARSAIPPMPTAQNVPLIPGLQASIEADVARDPEAAQRAQEERIRKAYELTPEQRAVYTQGIAQRQKMFDETYDPERQRQEGLKRFLIGAGGRRYGEFGAGAGAGLAYDEAQRAQKLKDFEAMQKSREGLVSLEREGIKPSIEGGLKDLEVTGGLRRQGQASGANIFGTQQQAATSKYDTDVKSRDAALNREVEMARVAAQNAANAVQREALDFSRMQGHLNTIVTNRARAVEAVQKRFGPQMSMLEMQLQATPTDKKLLGQRDILMRQIDAEVDKVTKDFDDAKALVESRLYGRSGAGSGGYTVRKKKPTK